VDKILEKLKHEYTTEDARYAYADSIANAFLTSQIKALQEERGLTQEELAKLVGTQQSGISRWLNSGFSTCKVETLRKFAKAYGIRLWISFAEFGSLPEDVGGFTERRLAPRKFEDDPAFKEHAEEPKKTAVATTPPQSAISALANAMGPLPQNAWQVLQEWEAWQAWEQALPAVLGPYIKHGTGPLMSSAELAGYTYAGIGANPTPQPPSGEEPPDSYPKLHLVPKRPIGKEETPEALNPASEISSSVPLPQAA
jgi:transcriptional regulator with XRE-family HTH domain